MKKWLSAALLLFVAVTSFGQIEFSKDKVNVDFSIDRDGDEAFVIAKVKVVDGWHINAIKLPEGSFGYASSFKLDANSNFKLIGSPVEPKPHTFFDEVSKEMQAYHEGRFKIKQKIKILSSEDFNINATFDFQPCDSVKCLTPDNYKASIKVMADANQDGTEINADNDTASNNIDTNVANSENLAISDSTNSSASNNESEVKGGSSDLAEGEEEEEEESLWGIFIVSFISGLAALLTPCVFPMIPMTVSFFTKQSKTKAKGISNALLYGLSIIVIYILLGSVITAIFGADVLNKMSTNPIFNLVFFVLLVVFAVSFLGAFEIRMPTKWVNRADRRADKGGLIGIFFMALALALVSFSCTGPIVGTLIVEAAAKGGIAPIVGMFGFSLALALPFALFAAFPGWMNSLPKSGGWLNSVKVVLGFLELALAFKFLSNADLAWQSHFLEREVFIAIWIGIFVVLGLYLIGKIRLPHDSPIEKLKVGRVLFATLVFSFVMYLIPGMWGAPLKLINAFPPPKHYSESPQGVGGGGGGGHAGEHIEGTHIGAQDLPLFNDYDKALAYAKKVNKPLFLDFTGWNCVNCRKMEENVWGTDGVIDILRDDVVIVSLYVDERTDLPKEEQIEITLPDGRKKVQTTVGEKWLFKQMNDYNIASQPYYRMQDPNGKDLSNGGADYEHNGNREDFLKWLKEGLKEVKK